MSWFAQDKIWQMESLFEVDSKHWKAIKWILCYLNNTTEVGLMYSKAKEETNGVVGYVNFSLAED